MGIGAIVSTLFKDAPPIWRHQGAVTINQMGGWKLSGLFGLRLMGGKAKESAKWQCVPQHRCFCWKDGGNSKQGPN